MAKVLVPLAERCEEVEAMTVSKLLRRAAIEMISAGRGTVLAPRRRTR